MNTEKRHSTLGFTNPGIVNLRIDMDTPKQDDIKEKQKTQAETLKNAADNGTPFCEKCQIEEDDEEEIEERDDE